MTRKHDKNTEDILKDIPNGKIITMQIVLNFSIDLSTLLCRSITAEVEEWAGKCRINPQYIWAPEIYLSTHCIHVRILP